MKKLFLGAMALLAAVTLVACGSKKDAYESIKENKNAVIQILSRVAPKLAPLTFGMFLIDTHSPMREKIYGLFFDRVVDGLHGILAAWWIIIVLFVVYGIIVWCLRLIPAVKKVL